MSACPKCKSSLVVDNGLNWTLRICPNPDCDKVILEWKAETFVKHLENVERTIRDILENHEGRENVLHCLGKLADYIAIQILPASGGRVLKLPITYKTTNA